MTRIHARTRRAFSLIEVVISVLIIGGMMVAVMNTIGSTALTRRLTADRVRGEALAHDLLDEILMRAYEDPELGGATFGAEAGESGSDRSLFDDVDDYAGWEASPPVRRNGATIGGFDGWTRGVEVTWCAPDSPETDRADDSRLKRITVIVKRGDRVVATVRGLRSSARDEFGG